MRRPHTAGCVMFSNRQSCRDREPNSVHLGWGQREMGTEGGRPSAVAPSGPRWLTTVCASVKLEMPPSVSTGRAPGPKDTRAHGCSLYRTAQTLGTSCRTTQPHNPKVTADAPPTVITPHCFRSNDKKNACAWSLWTRLFLIICEVRLIETQMGTPQIELRQMWGCGGWGRGMGRLCMIFTNPCESVIAK
jgi:hypothetical protein